MGKSEKKLKVEQLGCKPLETRMGERGMKKISLET